VNDTTAVIYINLTTLIMAEKKAVEMNTATLLRGFHDGFILRNAGEYLSFFEVSQFLITCKDWRLVLKGAEAPVKEFWKCLGRKVLGSLIMVNPQWGGLLTLGAVLFKIFVFIKFI
jgi:hypothetical protein